jgi:error-prone DNA polymerase
MGFYAPRVLIGDARRHGVPVYAPDVNLSQEDCTLEGGVPQDGSESAPRAVRLGLRYVHGLGEARRTEIVASRGERPFAGLPDFCRRTRLPRALVENLIRAGALDGLAQSAGQTRRDLLWQLGGLVYPQGGLGLEAPVPAIDLPDLGRLERMLWEYELLGLVPGEHLMSVYRDRLRAQGVLCSADLAARRPGERVWVAGMVIVRQRPPSAKGFVFLTLEDEGGLINLIVRPKVYERCRDVLRGSPLLLVEGAVLGEGGVASVQVYRAVPLLNR